MRLTHNVSCIGSILFSIVLKSERDNDLSKGSSMEQSLKI